MTPANIVGMALLNGLNIIALTDHNTSKNCPAFFAQARLHGIVPVPGMELTTAEDIHVVCLFRELSDAMKFDMFVSGRRMLIQNKPEIFGRQIHSRRKRRGLRRRGNLLINATDITLEEAKEAVFSRRRSMLSRTHRPNVKRNCSGSRLVPGRAIGYTAYELTNAASILEYEKRFPFLKNLPRAVSSDAHNLWSISEAEFSIPIDDEPYSSSLVRNRLIDYLLGIGRSGGNG